MTNNIIGTGTTDNNGDFTITIDDTDLNVGSNDLTVEFVEDSYYTGASQNLNVNVVNQTITPNSLTLNSNRNTLSYLHNESATLTAIYTANDNAGKRVTFSGAEFDVTMSNGMNLTFGNEATISNIQMTENGSSIYIGDPNDLLLIQNLGEGSYGLARVQDNFPTRINYIDISLGFSYNGNTLSYYDDNGTLATYDITGLAKRIVSSSASFSVVSSAIGVLTDSNGVATVSYTSKGVGDVTLTAECSSLQETYTIQDCLFYDNSLTDKSSDYSYINNSKVGRLVHGNDYYYTTVEQNKGHVPLKVIDINGNFHFEVTLKGYNSNNYAFTLHKSSTEYLSYNFYPSSISKYWYPSETKQGNDLTFNNMNSYHRITLDKVGDVVTFNVFDGETLICSDSYTLPSTFQNISLTPCISPYGYNTYRYNEITFKNVLIKPLSPNVLSLSSDKEILSYADEDSCTLTATLTNNNVGISGKTITFKDMYNEVTVQTDSNGEATYEYFSQGDGDVTITAECMSLQETYTIYDWYRYDDCSTDKTSNYIKGSYTSLTFDTDHYVMSTSTDDVVGILNDVDNVQFEILLKHNNNVGGIQIRQDISTHANGAVALYNNANNTTYLALFPWSNIKSQNNVTNNSDYYRYILTINGSSVTAKIENSNGTSLFSGTTSKSLSAKHFCIFNVGNNTLNIKEIVVKPLLTSSPPKVDKPEEPETDELE